MPTAIQLHVVHIQAKIQKANNHFFGPRGSLRRTRGTKNLGTKAKASRIPVGKSKRLNGNEHNDHRVKTQFQLPPPPDIYSRRTSSDQGKKPKSHSSIHFRFQRKGNNKGAKNTTRTLSLKRIHSTQKRRKNPPYNKFKKPKSILKRSQIQNGDSSSSKQMHPGEFMGSNNRPEGRLLSNPPSVVIPQIFRLHDRQQNLSLPIHAIRPLPGPMGAYTRHETNSS